MVYNQSTVQLVAEQAVNATSSSGAARATIRYQFRPVGYDSAADFYAYNSHFKAFDPIERVSTWTNSSSFRDVHTQSRVTTAQFSGQAVGGIDDRFDFQLVTAAVRDGRGFD